MPDNALLDHVAALVPDLAAHAAALDETPQFPRADFDALSEAGLLQASLPVSHGGHGFGEGGDGADYLCRMLVALGEGNLAVARLYEAHVNALQLAFRYGTDEMKQRCARDAAANQLFALWVTDPAGGGVRLQASGGAFVLAGAKAFCSGAGAASRALITAATPSGIQMLIVPLEQARVIPSNIKLAGMRAAVTGSVDFTGMNVSRADFLGAEGDYLREPVFSAGAWRGSAGAVGGLTALVRLHRAEMLDRRRDADPHQRARFGQLLMAHETARLWLRRAARRACLEDGPAAEIVAYVNLARLAIEAACLDAVRLTQRSLGLGAFIAGHSAERICRDLAVYLRQPAPDETLDKAASYYFAAGLPGDS
jgi:alkylation response protein AidB-like acyl-CoA dehydrogenase